MAENALIRRLKALTGFRAFFVTLLLGSFFLFDIQYVTLPYSNAIFYFIIFQYLLTIFYSIFMHRIKNLYMFAYTQLILDVLSEIALIYLTGGIESWFSFTLILTVLSSSIVLNKKAGYITASLSGILYGTLIDLQFYNLLPIPYEKTVLENEFLYNIFIHILSLYVTAYLGGYISHRLERTVLKLEEKDSHLKDLELFNTEVIESLPSGLFTTDTVGVALVFNRAAEEITGKKKGDVIGRSIETALPFLRFPFKYIRREEVLEFKSQDRKIIGITISVLNDTRGQETGFIGVFQDLTQLQKLEAEMKQKEKWAAIGELSANIAHEIRNPLASLRGSIEMLREDRIPASHKSELMDIALKEMERLNGIITDFLTYSSPRSLDLQRIDLHLLLSETLELLGNIEQSKNRVSIKKEFNGPLYFDVDPQKFTQVFWNLGINAIEAMQGGGELTVSTKNIPGSIKIIFSDTGAGIPPSDIEKIFYPFFTTKESGTGLGLAIAFRIIEEHNGRINVRSEPGIYTAFEIILPSSI